MANPVTEELTDWQNDAAGLDSNAPTAGSNAGIGQAQDLSGNLRLLKSEIRSESLIKSWERWLGLLNLAGSNNVAFSFVAATQFTVNDDFTNTNRNVAAVGRRVRAFLSGSVIYGTITAANYANPNTTVTVVWDSGSLDGTLSEVQFGPEVRSLVQAVPVMLTNRSGSTLALGDPAILDASNDASVTQTGTQGSQHQFVVALAAVANLAIGPFASSGLISTLRVIGAVTRGHYLQKAAAGQAEDSGIAQGDAVDAPAGAFAVAMSSFAGPGVGAVSALLFGHTVTVPEVAADSNGFGTRFLDDVDPVLGDMADGDLWYVHD
jgi:hypothetical protein